MITDYDVVFGGNVFTLAEKVKVKIKNGLEPFGNVFQDDDGDFYQVMIKREEKTSL